MARYGPSVVFMINDKLSGSSVLVGGFYETESLNGLRAVILRTRGANSPRAQEVKEKAQAGRPSAASQDE